MNYIGRRLPTSTTLKTVSPRKSGHGSARQQHAGKISAPQNDRVSMCRKRQHSSRESLQAPHPHMISGLSELLDTCTDAQYIEIIKNLPAEWTATNDRGMTVTKRQLEMAQWEAYKDDHNVLTLQQTIMLTRQFPTTLTQYDTLLAQ
jgi:hypothetical protein